MCLDRLLTHADCRVAIAMLLYFHNSTSGALYPSRRQVAELLDMKVKTVRRATEKMKALKYLDYERGSGGRSRHNNYVFKRRTSGTRFEKNKGDIWDPLMMKKGVIRDPGRETNGTHARRTKRTHALTPSNRPSATPSPSPRDSEASASQEAARNKRFWEARRERHSAELENCTDPDRRKALEEAIARAVNHLSAPAGAPGQGWVPPQRGRAAEDESYGEWHWVSSSRLCPRPRPRVGAGAWHLASSRRRGAKVMVTVRTTPDTLGMAGGWGVC